MDELTCKSSLDRAIQVAGGLTALASKMGTTPSRVSNWRKRGIPAEMVLKIERAVECQVTRYDLRPDIYPRG